jgi:hydroxymethylglutaryl-CoA lyase
MTTIEIVEVGPRDGLQNEKRTLSIDTRVELITRLVHAGVTRMEAVSFVHPTKVPQMAGAEEVMSQVPGGRGVDYIGLVLNRRGVERARLTPVTEVNVVLPVTDTFGMRNQGKTVADMITETAAAVKLAKEAKLRTSVTLAVAFGCPFEGDVPFETVADVFSRVADLGVDEIAFADTIGVGVPAQVRQFGELATSRLSAEKLRFHFHNTRNTGYANALAAAEIDYAGTVALDASVGGFGGCPFAPAATGNIGTEDLLYALERSRVDAGSIAADQLIDIAAWLSVELDSPIQSLLPKAGWFSAA